MVLDNVDAVGSVLLEGSAIEMRVVLVSRRRDEGRYSLETLFSDIAREIGREADVVEYSLTSKWGSWRDVLALRGIKADVYHIAGDCLQMALFLPYRKTVVTVPDPNHFVYDLHGARRWVYKKLWFDVPLRLVSEVTAISGKTKRDLEAYCPNSGKEVRVVECCVSSRYERHALDFDEACPRVLFVGTAPWKNLRRLTAALQGISCRLVIVGPIDGPARDLLAELEIDFENHVNLSDDALRHQYEESDMVAFVSEREGFGLPIVEAQAVGRPVITSDISPMREVAGAGACLVDPSDVEAIRAGVLRIIQDRDYRDSLVEEGIRNVRAYSAEAVAAGYLDVYRAVEERSAQGGS